MWLQDSILGDISDADKPAWKVAAPLHFQAASESRLQSVPNPGHGGGG